jgi:hypothetical protein
MTNSNSRRLGAALAALTLLALAGCQSGSKTDTAQPPPPAAQPTPDHAMNQPPANTATQTPPEPATTIPAETTPKPAAPKPKVPKAPPPKPAEPEPAPAPAVHTVPAGTSIRASLSGELRSDKTEAGAPITLSVVDAVTVDGTVVIPAGATVTGEVVSAKASGKTKGRGDITLAFKSVTDASGKSHPIAAETFYAQAESGTDADVARIAGGAAAGAIIGGILGGKDDAALGGLIGAAAGTGTVLATAGPQVKLASGQLFEIKLIEPIEIAKS